MEVINDIEQEDIYNIAPPFVELEMDEYDETDDIIHQNVQELWEFWQQKDTEEMVYSNIGHTFIQSNHATINEGILQEVNNFIYNYVNIHEFPSPGQHM
ncbi:10999_t:CDS:2 [Cetraspora pellucida]|uniref:10999_t:CDS:1 n=1 Tax=Cetraspora pellucida TaxID=1433469 RepID=A0A9N9NSW3_9GLOM|nr:10999_t:CDS:2 [Cetraspora pellucida]